MDALLETISNLLCQVAAYNDVNRKTDFVSKFDAAKVPSQGVLPYISRLVDYMEPSQSAILCTLIYLDRAQRHPKIQLTSLSFHRLFAAALRVATKYMDDFFFNNESFARVAGITLGELNDLELELLFILSFDAHVSPETYSKYAELIVPSTPTSSKTSNMDMSPVSTSPTSPKRKCMSASWRSTPDNSPMHSDMSSPDSDERHSKRTCDRPATLGSESYGWETSPLPPWTSDDGSDNSDRPMPAWTSDPFSNSKIWGNTPWTSDSDFSDDCSWTNSEVTRKLERLEVGQGGQRR